MNKSIHWFMNKMVVKKVISGALLLLFLWSIGNFHLRLGSLLVLYIYLKNIINLNYDLTVNVLILIVWSTIPGSSMWKMPSIISANLHCSTGIKSRHIYHVDNRLVVPTPWCAWKYARAHWAVSSMVSGSYYPMGKPQALSSAQTHTNTT